MRANSMTPARTLTVLFLLGLLGLQGARAVTPAATGSWTATASWKSVLEPLSAGGWTFISDGPPENPSAVYASTHNVLHDGNVVTAWMRWEFSRPQAEVYPLHYLSAVTREQLDCGSRNYRRSAVFYYLRNNLQEKGPAFTALNDETNWKAAIPGSEADAMLNWGCMPAASHHARSAAAGDARKSAAPAAATTSAAAKTAKLPPAGKAGLQPDTQSSAPAAATGGINLSTTR